MSEVIVPFISEQVLVRQNGAIRKHINKILARFPSVAMTRKTNPFNQVAITRKATRWGFVCKYVLNLKLCVTKISHNRWRGFRNTIWKRVLDVRCQSRDMKDVMRGGISFAGIRSR